MYKSRISKKVFLKIIKENEMLIEPNTQFFFFLFIKKQNMNNNLFILLK